MLTVSGIDLHYGAAQALRGVSLSLEEGQITCVMGRNGVGKTSLLKAIIGHHPVSAGSVELAGNVLTRSSVYDRARRGIGYVPQGREIFPLLSVRENLQTALAAAPPGTRTVPDEIFDLFPVLDRMMRRRGGDLSGGQQQQLAIARAMVARPKVLLLDEPTEGIQPSIIKDIGRAILYLKEKAGLAILLVEQYLDFARELADAIHIMDRGAFVFSGRPSDLDRDDVRRHLTV